MERIRHFLDLGTFGIIANNPVPLFMENEL